MGLMVEYSAHEVFACNGNYLKTRPSVFIRHIGLELSSPVMSLSELGIKVILTPQNELGAIVGLYHETVR